jgi:hypothetical protein
MSLSSSSVAVNEAVNQASSISLYTDYYLFEPFKEKIDLCPFIFVCNWTLKIGDMGLSVFVTKRMGLGNTILGIVNVLKYVFKDLNPCKIINNLAIMTDNVMYLPQEYKPRFISIRSTQ